MLYVTRNAIYPHNMCVERRAFKILSDHITFDTELWSELCASPGQSIVYVLAVRQVKQGTETTRFRTGSTLQPCQYVHMQAS